MSCVFCIKFIFCSKTKAQETNMRNCLEDSLTWQRFCSTWGIREKPPQKITQEVSENSCVKCNREAGGGTATREQRRAKSAARLIKRWQSAPHKDLPEGEAAGAQLHRAQACIGSCTGWLHEHFLESLTTDKKKWNAVHVIPWPFLTSSTEYLSPPKHSNPKLPFSTNSSTSAPPGVKPWSNTVRSKEKPLVNQPAFHPGSVPSKKHISPTVFPAASGNSSFHSKS